MMLKIMLVDDHAMIREALCSLIECQADMEIVAQAENGRVAVERATEFRPDVVIMDVNMPGMNGIEATRLIKAANPNIKIIALSAFNESSFVTSMIQAGASGYMLKDNLFEELVKTIQAVAQLPPSLSAVE